jgi:hypothetical protein
VAGCSRLLCLFGGAQPQRHTSRSCFYNSSMATAALA